MCQAFAASHDTSTQFGRKPESSAESSKVDWQSIRHPLRRLTMDTLHRSSGVVSGGLRIAPAGLGRPCRVAALRRRSALALRKGRHAPAITALRHVTGHEKVGASVRVNEKVRQCTKRPLEASQLSPVQCAATFQFNPKL